MKRKLAILLALCLTAGTVGESIGMLQAEAAEVSETVAGQESDYEYRETDGGIKIDKYKGSGTKIVIPSEIEGKTVTGIGSFAFNKCTAVESIVIPNGIKEIESYAFSDCSNLNHIEIPGSVTSIKASVFSGCSSLGSVEIPSSVTDLGGDVFYNCTSLKNVVIPNGITSLGSSIFYGCSSLESIQIPVNVKYIGSNAFGNCTSLKNIKLPTGITSIADKTFWNCDALNSIQLPEGVASIGASVFSSCDNLKSVIIPASVVGIEQNAFDAYNTPTLYCAKGSYAETYAQKNGFSYRDISEAPEENPGTGQPGGSGEGELGNPGGENPGTGQPGGSEEGEPGNPGGESPGTGQPGGSEEGEPGNPGEEEPGKPVVKAEQAIMAENVEKKVGDEPFLLNAETDGDGILSYESKNPEVAKVDESGMVTIVSAGTAQIVIIASETEGYQAARKTIAIAVIPEGYTAVHDISELSAIRNDPRGDYILMNDIDMSSTNEGGDDDCGTGWDSIETFDGTLDGNGYRVVGMQIFGEFASGANVGLFEEIGDGGEVKNFGMVDGNISIISGSGMKVGMLAGNTKDLTNFENCYVNGKITVKGTERGYIGGLIGYDASGSATISDSYNACDIDGSQTEGNYYIGGICGNSAVAYGWAMEQCYNSGMVKGNENSLVGAVCGEYNVRDIKNLKYLKGTAAQGIGDRMDNASCTSLTDAQMKNQNYFTGFDFVNTWEIDPYCEGYPYPQLKNNRMIKVSAIELSPAPVKLMYNQGETLRIAGAALKITYEDGISTTIPLKADMLSGYDMSEIGKQEVLVNYGDAETSFEIEVKEIPVASITVSQGQLSLYRAKEQQLNAAIAPVNATDKTVVWESDNPAVAEVSGNGLVKAKSKGTATITASSSNGLQSQCTVTVLVPALVIQLSHNAVTLKEGGRIALTAQISPLESTDAIQWKSANPGIAEVFEGNIVAKSAGTTTVTAYTESGAAAGCTVTVQKTAPSGSNNQNPGGNNQNPDGNGEGSGGKLAQKLAYTSSYYKTYGCKPFQLNARVVKGEGSLTYASSDPKVIAVTGSGKATVKGTGIAVITVKARATAKYEETTAKITVEVTPAKQRVESVKAQKGKKLKIRWKKDTKASGYQIQYSMDKKFKKAKKTVTITKNGTVSKLTPRLKVGKRYYVRVRSYKNVKKNGKVQRLCGAWSGIKRSGKVKK